MRICHLTAMLLLSVSLSACANTQSAKDGTASTSTAAADDTELTEIPIRNYLSARFAASEHDLGEAAKFYRATLDEDPDNMDLLLATFNFSSSAGDLESAAKYAQKIIEKTPGDRSARLILALTAIKHHQYGAARTHLAASQRGAFTALVGTLFDAWAAAGQRNYTDVDSDLKTLAAQTGGVALAAVNRALIVDVLGRSSTEVDQAYRTALELNPANARLIDAYGRFLERNGRLEEAQALYLGAADISSVAPIVSVAQARIASRKKPDKLVRNAEEGAAEALVGIASSLSDRNSVDISIFYLRIALYMRPDLDLASVILGSRYEALDKYDEANAVYSAIKKDSPYYRMTAIESALNEARLGDTDKSIAMLKDMAEANPDDVEIWTSLGDTYRGADRFSDAVSAYNHAIAQLGGSQQRDWTLYFARASAREQINDWPAAEDDLKKALEINPDEPQVMNYLGYTWIDRGQNLTEGLEMLEKARSLRPFDGYIVDSVGWAYYRLGRYDDAAQTLQDAVQLVPGDPTVNDHLGDAFWRIGRKLDARFQWNHALAFGPEPKERAEIEKKLQVGLSADAPG